MDMNYDDYLEIVLRSYSKMDEVQLSSYIVKRMFDVKDEKIMFATKLKNFSFVSYLSQIDIDDIINYSSTCLNYALKIYKGLPRGFQNGVSTFNVLVSENVTDEAKKFAITRPKKHFAAFEIPIIVDLSNENIFYYKDTPMWGGLYYRYFREFINKHFNI